MLLRGLLEFRPHSSSRMSDRNWRCLESINRNALTILASGRRHRLQDRVQPKFGLTAKEIERPTGIAHASG